MARETKEKIMKAALELFSKKGYLGTSMSDIAAEIGITKGALYKHYENKQTIFDAIIEEMEQLDAKWAREYGMPEDEAGEAYSFVSPDAIREFSIAQFKRWTEDLFSSQFRKMLTLEQYRDANMSRIYQNYLSIGPANYMKMIFCGMNISEDKSEQLALEFYGPMHFLYGIRDCTDDGEKTVRMLETHIQKFFERLVSEGLLKRDQRGKMWNLADDLH